MKPLARFRLLLGLVIVLFALPMAVLAQDYSPRLIVNTGFLNIRSGPGVSYDIIATVPGGARLPVLAMDNGRLWYQVETIAGEGWVNSYYTIGRGDFSNVLITSDDPPPITGPHLVVNTGNLHIRSGPGASHSSIGTVPGGTKLPVLAMDSGRLWYQVSSVHGNGWANSYYTVGRGDFSNVPITSDDPPPITGPHLVVNTGNLHIRSGPGISYDSIGTVPGGTKLSVLAMDNGRLWYQVSSVHGNGWVNSFYTVGRGDFSRVPITSDDPPPITGPHLVVNTGNLNIRSGPSINHRVVASVPGGTKLPVIGIANDRLWYQVESAAGVGWANSYYTVGRGNFVGVPVTEASEGPSIPAARVIVNTAYLNIRSGPSASTDIVATVGGGTELTVLGMARDRVWYLVEGDFGQGWLNNTYVIFRGDYSSVLVIN